MGTRVGERVYLGDAVYCAFDGFHLVLTTEDGVGQRDRIFLDPGVAQKLADYMRLINSKMETMRWDAQACKFVEDKRVKK